MVSPVTIVSISNQYYSITAKKRATLHFSILNIHARNTSALKKIKRSLRPIVVAVARCTNKLLKQSFVYFEKGTCLHTKYSLTHGNFSRKQQKKRERECVHMFSESEAWWSLALYLFWMDLLFKYIPIVFTLFLSFLYSKCLLYWC